MTSRIARLLALGLVSASLVVPARAGARPAAAPPAAGMHATAEKLDALPMAFEPNLGQADARVKFLARGRGYTVFLTEDGATLSLAKSPPASDERLDDLKKLVPHGMPESTPKVVAESVALKIEGARSDARVVAGNALPGRVSYFVGSDPNAWHRGVPTYEGVRYEAIYEGIDAVFYGTQHQLEYDFVVRPGADASQIRLRFEGQRSVSVGKDGDLRLALANGEIRQQRALVYQEKGGSKRAVEAHYVVDPTGRVGFELGDYDRSSPLTIDPVVVYGDYLGGGSSNDSGQAIAVDASGAAYIAGRTYSNDFPVTAGAFEPQHAGSLDAFVVKLDAAGAIVYSTYVGGSYFDQAFAIAVDSSGAAYIAGSAEGDLGSEEESDFPVTEGAFDTTFNGSADAFVTKLDPSGASLVYSTFLGGSYVDTAYDLALDSTGSVYVAGSTDRDFDGVPFPTTNGAFDTTANGFYDAFVTKLNPAGSALVYSTFLGGLDYDEARAIDVDTSGRAVVIGRTINEEFPTTPGAFDTTFNGSPNYDDIFVTKLDASGGSLLYSTFVGGTDTDSVYDVALDGSGRAWVVGSTTSTDFPIVAGALEPSFLGETDAFVLAVSASGAALERSTYYGDSSYDYALGVAVGPDASVYVAGLTASEGFPSTDGVFQAEYAGGGSDAFVLKLDPDFAGVDYSSLLGGLGEDSCSAIAVDATGAAYVTGQTGSLDFPSVGDGGTARDDQEAFATKISPAGDALVYSRALGGVEDGFNENPSEEAASLAVDSSGAVYVTGTTPNTNYPRTPAAVGDADYVEPIDDGALFVTKVSADGAHVEYSAILGSYRTRGRAIAVDESGAAYLTGSTASPEFPTTPGAFATTFSGGIAAFVTKITPDGSLLDYSTFLAGDLNDEAYATGIAVDGAGSAYVVGRTIRETFPTTPGAFDTSFNGGSDIFVTKVASDGASLLYSTFVGGTNTDEPADVAVDPSGAAYVVGSGWSFDFPTTAGAYDTSSESYDGYIFKLEPSGSALAFSTFLGGSGTEVLDAVAIDAVGSPYVVGYTTSFDYPTTQGAFQAGPLTGSSAAIAAKLTSDGSALAYSTLLDGGDEDEATGVAVDSAGSAIVVGHTSSSDFPTTQNALDATLANRDGFVTVLDVAGSAATYSSFLGGSQLDIAKDVTLGPSGTIYVTGGTSSSDFLETGFGIESSWSAFVVALSLGLPAGADTVGIYTQGTGAWFLRNSASAGNADLVFGFGPVSASFVPLAGDWDGDGVDTVGLYDSANGTFFLRNSASPGPADVTFTFGAGGAGIRPLAGDWDGDGDDTVGLYVDASGVFFLRNQNASGPADVTFTFGAGGAGLVPVAGDWNGDGATTVGVYAPATGAFFLRNTNANGGADLVFTFGGGGAVPVVGDWDGDGDETVGLYASGVWFLRDENANGGADYTFGYGPAGVIPVVGDWDGV